LFFTHTPNQEGDNGLLKAKAMEAMLKTLSTKMAQADFDLKKAKCQPDARFKKDFRGCQENVKKLLSSLETVLVQRTLQCFCFKEEQHMLHLRLAIV
jgi:hypothetical protein